ncbi:MULTISPECIES: cytochrome ubiquinol oxidase subunit I [Pantoea]|uniref:Cytochrome bd-II ubiquinol oxidase subunit 1 n=1 Tax=Pantoea ananas TaxID=553 RepID=A0AAJ1D3C1_PANAN|nr:cytochrome ubiquinol oxidase subunit I [Pantoea ananatis]MCW0308045.1 Cytochrome bd-II ubiquinol oxidase subunit 1 [Pantoea ananatis]MCW0331160.1 Cytochrome bd-II ubiquinol oxidase subunit 1 [Pantoea ananatis]MCW0340046.1 Cytochrome bd-II ubiquinol oxidase subunit 1 [Pantoea ananatis]MCW0346473.1 Cytochrome bd-II ubiquinol oxidase subunit 1 [Pantoea ananatis]MCW0350908.1 Cytochrome bd-II ubiquinol oxidase subunit 1 [Pantoea ananatis]
MPESEIVLLLSRAQFALTIGMHIVLAAFTLGLGLIIVLLEGAWLRYRRSHHWQALQFWMRVFSLTVAVGAVSGVVMEFQFGTNWSPFAHKVGGVMGPLMFYEILVAFFLESGLTGVMLFGMGKINPKLHFVVTCLVALGAFLSAFWILAANSWMQTPVGYLRDEHGFFRARSWISIVFSPSFPLRFTHMVLASLIASFCVTAGASAWRLLKQPADRAAKCVMSWSLWLLLTAMPLQIVTGDLQGEKTRDYQPAKLAAIEGSWRRPPHGEGEPLRLFALPDQKVQVNHGEVAIPTVASLYLRHNLTGHIKSLSEFQPDQQPPVWPVFFAFRVMVGMGLIIFVTSLTALWLRYRRELWPRRLMKWVVGLTPAGFIALLAGWIVTEVGRQPWTIYGLLRTDQSIAPLSLSAVIFSFTGIIGVYSLVFGLGMYYFLRLVNSFDSHALSNEISTEASS